MGRKQRKGACMCSDLVTARWTDAFGQQQETVVNLEEIWAEGAVLQFEHSMRPGAPIQVQLGSARFEGIVTDCKSDFIGNFVEMQFAEGCRWSRGIYEPDHLFDPATLSPTEELRTKNNRLLEEVVAKLLNRVA